MLIHFKVGDITSETWKELSAVPQVGDYVFLDGARYIVNGKEWHPQGGMKRVRNDGRPFVRVSLQYHPI